ncbi:bifunctional UDP-N-acetylglucosamine diphosphorylase/glucosamine-1-phosphate N-acetyltransferase GlmU, partial [Desulforudis sp. 1190]|uniref:bifunctional UDP-N-acetylglucosamine diphosphorylase/glucosamine-1-phosphate N-acetyltransferase GlmU n=1 Tax=Desulforudis sp. 1190 TaxID=3416136 RepID=UPI003CF5AFA9
MSLVAVVLAAGKGTRMKSRHPKVLHQIAGRPMLHYVLDAVSEAGAGTTVVVAGYGYDAVRAAVGDAAKVVLQDEQRGTAHAVMQTREALSDFTGDILVVCGDTPLITGRTLAGLVSHHRAKGAAATVLTAIVEDPTGYGRVIRDGGGMVARIVEQKDATPDELAVREINTGVYCFSAAGFFDSLRKISNNNQQGEYYLTDIIGVYVAGGRPVASYLASDPVEIMGINDRLQLAAAEKVIRRRVLEGLMRSGVTIVDPDSTYIDAPARIGPDTVIHPQTL